jgi:sulfite reductase (NADPH) flavoprotein alpha-component
MLNWLKSHYKLSTPVLTPALAGLQQADWLIIYASQSGKAKKLAEQTAEQLTPAKVVLVNLGELKPADLVFLSGFYLLSRHLGMDVLPTQHSPLPKKCQKLIWIYPN